MENLFNFCYEDFNYPDMFPMQTMEPAEPVNAGEEVMKDGKKFQACIFPGCGKIFRFKSELARHSVVHNTQRSFNCPHVGCFKTFKREDALKNHIRIHTGEQPFKCDFEGCHETFPTKAGLRYHMLKHNGDKTFFCSFPGCEKSFLTQAQLRQHENSINFHKKLTWQVPETKEAQTPATKVENYREPPVDSYFAPNPTKKIKEPSLDDFFAPNLDGPQGIEWGTQDQLENEDDVNEDLQENFEKMVKVILKDNNAMKKRLDMCGTLMNLMQENNVLKAKLKKVGGYEDEETTSVSENDDKTFSFLNLSGQRNVF